MCHLANYDVSMQVQAHMAVAIKATGAGTLVTVCPACRMQLEDGLARAGLSPGACHVVQLLEQACGITANQLHTSIYREGYI
ncbi:MAG: glycolate oxidase iron-sulfur subunit [Moorella sp. (in: firmicutes)]|nr:glycolate oxidase iron-sulfur subunit [Moorella sp. (in: firmicutes)]